MLYHPLGTRHPKHCNHLLIESDDGLAVFDDYFTLPSIGIFMGTPPIRLGPSAPDAAFSPY